MDRRVFARKLLAGVSSYAFIETVLTHQAISMPIKPIMDHWTMRLNELCLDLGKQSISLIEWQTQIEALYQQIELDELMLFIDFDNLLKGFEYPDQGVASKTVRFPKLEGLPERTVFIKKIIGMQKDRAIIPHGHSNMTSAHLVIQGEMHLRHYEKIRRKGQNLIIKPSIDRIVKPGESSSISDEKDNVHWFIANTETAFTFDVIMLDLFGENYDIQNLDMFEKRDLSDGSMLVPILDVSKAVKKYGKQHH